MNWVKKKQGSSQIKKNNLNSNQAELCRFLAYIGVIKSGYLV